MQHNAVCLSDKLLCQLISKTQIKTVVLLETTTVFFESQSFTFIKEDGWKVIFKGRTRDCVDAQIDGIEMRFEPVEESYFETGSLVFEDELCFGTELT